MTHSLLGKGLSLKLKIPRFLSYLILFFVSITIKEMKQIFQEKCDGIFKFFRSRIKPVMTD